MLPRVGVIVSIVLVGITMAALAVVLTVRPDPFRMPGETWEAGFLSGETIHLMPDGRFVAREWGDVWEGPVVEGTWLRTGDSVQLATLAKPGHVRTFRIELHNQCEVLVAGDVPSGGQVPNPYEAFSRVPERCALEL